MKDNEEPKKDETKKSSEPIVIVSGFWGLYPYPEDYKDPYPMSLGQ